MNLSIPLTSGVGNAFFYRIRTPLQILFLAFFSGRPDGFGELDQPVGCILPTVEQHVLDFFEQFGRNFLVDFQLAGIHDTHVQPRLDGVVQERRVHGFTHDVVAAKTETDIADPARDFCTRAGFLDLPRRLDEVDGVVVVFVHPGGNRQDVGIENDVFGREADAVDQQVVGAFADANLVVGLDGLTVFVKRHDHRCRAIASNQGCPFQECFLAVLQADRVHNGLALYRAQFPPR